MKKPIDFRFLTVLLAGLCVGASLWHGAAATVVGTLQDISLQALNTKLTFAPSTNVLLTTSGLSAGPPRTIETANGQFALPLEAGDYTVSLPLVPWRKPFLISVFATNGTVNITNLLTSPKTYTYTNNLNWIPAGTNLYFTAGHIGIGLSNPAARLEVRFDSASDSARHLLLSATNNDSAVGLAFQSPNSAANWQLGVSADIFKIGKEGAGSLLTLDSVGLLRVPSFATAAGTVALNADGSATFANGLSQIGNDGTASFGEGHVLIEANPLLRLRNNSTDPIPTQLLVESIDDGAVGVQFQSTQSTNNWNLYLASDNFRIGKTGLADYVVINPAGQLDVPQGYAVGGAIGITTNLAVLLPGPKTNVLVFTKGILTQIQ
jgi:hypothetical protein